MLADVAACQHKRFGGACKRAAVNLDGDQGSQPARPDGRPPRICASSNSRRKAERSPWCSAALKGTIGSGHESVSSGRRWPLEACPGMRRPEKKTSPAGSRRHALQRLADRLRSPDASGSASRADGTPIGAAVPRAGDALDEPNEPDSEETRGMVQDHEQKPANCAYLPLRAAFRPRRPGKDVLPGAMEQRNCATRVINRAVF